MEEEEEVELIEYFRVVSKRKILIIIGTLVCVVIGVIKTSRLPVTCHVEASVLVSRASDSHSVTNKFRHSLHALKAESILGKYQGYHLDSKMNKGSGVLKMNVKGPDIKIAKELLEEVVEKVLVDGSRYTEKIIDRHKLRIEDLETTLSEARNRLSQLELVPAGEKTHVNKGMNTEFAVIMQSLVDNRQEQIFEAIKDYRDEILRHELVIDFLVENKTIQIGGLEEVRIISRNGRTVMLSGIAGLIMFVFLAFFLEYLYNIKKREKEKKSI